MSFFNNLQQYVTSSVANLGLGSRRFSLSRQDSGENPNDYIPKTPSTTITIGAANNSSGTTPAAVVHHAGKQLCDNSLDNKKNSLWLHKLNNPFLKLRWTLMGVYHVWT